MQFLRHTNPTYGIPRFILAFYLRLAQSFTIYLINNSYFDYEKNMLNFEYIRLSLGLSWIIDALPFSLVPTVLLIFFKRNFVFNVYGSFEMFCDEKITKLVISFHVVQNSKDSDILQRRAQIIKKVMSCWRLLRYEN